MRLAGRAVILASAIVVLGAIGQAQAATTYLTSFGSATTSPTNPNPLSFPTGIALNETTGDIYVADAKSNRIEQFDATGNFIRMWGREVNQASGGDICPRAGHPGDPCQAGTVGTQAGWFDSPEGLAIDNSTGPAAGSLYVVDTNNYRVQRFTADGQFVLMWGKAVDQQTAGNVCNPAVTLHTCQVGLIGGIGGGKENGAFSWDHGTTGEPADSNINGGIQIATDGQGYIYVTDQQNGIQKFDHDGTFLAKTGTLLIPGNPSVAPDGDVYAAQEISIKGNAFIAQFEPSDFVPQGETGYHRFYGKKKYMPRVIVDPLNGYLLTLAADCDTTPTVPGVRIVEFKADTAQELDCTIPSSPAVALGGGLAISAATHKLYITDPSGGKVQVFEPPLAQLPEVTGQTATEITAKGARINADIVGNLDETTFHVEYGTAGPCSSNPCASTAEQPSLGAALTPRPGHSLLTDLQPATRYFFRVVATNGVGTEEGPDASFTTFATSTFTSCPNNLARQQTGAAFLLDCRAYELVSAEDQGGYNVESDLVSGQEPYAGYPRAGGRALYAIHDGGIPNTGRPTNRGPDPYLAVRDAEHGRWRTSYVGIPADVGSAAPFSSTLATAGAGLSTFAFSGPEICDPCFPGGAAGIPVRMPSGALVQGMVGAPGYAVTDPTPAGEVRRSLSADGSHLIFASKQQFASGGNNDGTNVSIYNRDLGAGVTRAVSKLPNTGPIQQGTDLAALDVSADGTRTLIGTLVSTDPAGNRYWHLYMHVGAAINTIDLTPGTSTGVLYAGMNDAGTRVYYTTRDPIVADGDTSVDLFLAVPNPANSTATVSRVSTGIGSTGDEDGCDPTANSYNPSDWNIAPGGPTDCSVVAIGGGGGVSAATGAVFFLSPEKLDGNGTENAPNLFYAAPGKAPHFVATLGSSDNAPLKPVAHLFRHNVGPFSYPEGAAIDRDDGSYYVLDTLANSGADNDDEDEAPNYEPGAFVQKFAAGGEKDLTFGDNSKLDGSNSTKGPFLEAGVGYNGTPVGVATQIAVDNSSSGHGELYVPDLINGALDKFDSSGNFITYFTTGLFGIPPSGVAVNQKTGNVYMSTAVFSSIYVFTSNGSPTGVGSFPVAGPALGVGVDANGNSYVVNGKETNLYNAAGKLVKVFDPNPSYGVSVDPGANLASAADDHVFIDEGFRVVEYDISGNEVATILIGFNARSVSLFADQGRVVISNPEKGNVLAYSAPQVPPDLAYDDSLVIDSVKAPESHEPAHFQLTPDGNVAAFVTAAPRAGFDNASHGEVYRYQASSGEPRCVSCNPTEASPSSNASLASDGSSLSDDGRVFFNSGEPLVLRDANARKDVYEWSPSAGRTELVSTGGGQFDSSLLGVSSDGTDALFFTREKLATNDGNGNLVRLYDARENGGFFTIPPPPQCAASDECHGPGSQAQPPSKIGTVPGGQGNTPTKRCPSGKHAVKRKGKVRCVKNARHHRKGARKAKDHKRGETR